MLAFAVALAAAACGRGGTDPAASSSPGPTPSVGPSQQVGVSAPPFDPGIDPVQPPAGAIVLHRWEELDDDIRRVGVAYRVPAALDAVRAQYREQLRTEGWSLIDAEFEDGGWELEWVKDGRELEVDLRSEGDSTIMEHTVSEPVAR